MVVKSEPVFQGLATFFAFVSDIANTDWVFSSQHVHWRLFLAANI